ncbi:hypothetical protein P261_02363 [Lachnospiraceae bacterium TWA4]|nr:hypothetical protein P261_02363 [Lachnospiraceae bacterium TWA4]
MRNLHELAKICMNELDTIHIPYNKEVTFTTNTRAKKRAGAIAMKDKSTMSVFEYLIGVIFYELVSMIWFQNILFRCLPEMTYHNSKLILWASLVGSIIFSTIVFKYNKTEWTKAATIIAPYGIFTVIAYYTTVPLVIKNVLIAGVLLSICYSVIKLTRKIKNKKHSGQIIKNRIYRCICVSNCILSTSMLVIMLFIGIKGVFGIALQNSSVIPEAYNVNSKQTINNNIDVIVKLQPNTWDKLNVKEKLDVMQTVANIEVHYLGIPNEVNVGTANLGQYTLGCYEDRTHTAYIDLQHIENGSVYDVLDICCHEVYHCYQHRLVETYSSIDEKSKSLKIYSKVQKYMKEFANYKNGYEDFCSYYNQKCESDAREYAEDAVFDYYQKIEEYADILQ